MPFRKKVVSKKPEACTTSKLAKSSNVERVQEHVSDEACSPSSTPAGSGSDDDTTTSGSAPPDRSTAVCEDVFFLEDPSAPPLSRGASAASWTKQSKKQVGKDASASDSDPGRQTSRKDKIKPLPPSKAGRPRLTPNGSLRGRASGTAGLAESAWVQGCVSKPHRPMMSRDCRNSLRVLVNLEPRNARIDNVGGCWGVCRAPLALPWCGFLFPCCSFPHELEQARRESSYVVIRDNAIEFNKPRVVMTCEAPAAATKFSLLHSVQGKPQEPRWKSWLRKPWCGWCSYHIRDDVRVLYFDDPVLHDVAAIKDSKCGSLRLGVCGSRGHVVRVQSRSCCGMVVRSRNMCCVPKCCVCVCRPVALSYDIPVKDAVDAASKIIQARDNALIRMRRDNDAHRAVPCSRS